ncbi:MAG: PQQ-binding-like beta-propeller repeat protein [Theionarchaea archaeon]|nr:PQQ-binding-like beta-propeller repeat protein [Theionarchaea archaeon]
MKKLMKNSKAHIFFIVLGFNLVMIGGCLSQIPFEEDDSSHSELLEEEQCITPLKRLSMSVAPNGISTTSDGSLFAVTTGSIFLFNNEAELLWTKKGIGGNNTYILSNGSAVLAESYNHEEPWKSTIVKLDSQGNTLWERQTGLIGFDGLAVTPDGSFVAVGATAAVKKGHLMLFDGDGNRLWDHQIDGRIETVAVSVTGYVVAGPRNKHIYVYDVSGQQIFDYPANSSYDSQDTAIAPDEQFFLFGSEHAYLNCYTLHGKLLWQSKVGPLCNIRISENGEYIVVGTSSSALILLDRNGTILWKKKVTDAFFIEEVAISAKLCVYCHKCTGRGIPSPAVHICLQ